MAQLTCKNLTLGYDNRAIQEDLNFSIDAGDYLCIVGENGSGKSTLMKTLLHLQAPISGSIELGDGLPSPPLRRRSIRYCGLHIPVGHLPGAGFHYGRYHAFLGSASLAGRIHRTAFRRFGKQRRQQQTGGCYAGRWRFDCVDRAFSVPPFRF